MFPAPYIVVGLGQLGTLFSEGFLRLGHPVVPVLRGSDRTKLTSECAAPELVLITVGEDELPGQLAALPPAWQKQVALVQNELRPRDYAALASPPTVLVVWFERKNGKAPIEVRTSVVSGPNSELFLTTLKFWSLSCVAVGPERLPVELALKNLYILSLNLAGLAHPGSAGSLLRQHGDYFWALASELVELERALEPNAALSKDELFRELSLAIERDPEHGASGRTAKRRLERTIALARQFRVNAPLLEELAERFPFALTARKEASLDALN